MIKINDNFYYPIFEYIYLFVMVIYMAQMTPDTARMVGGLSSGSIFPLLIPIVLTIILLIRNPISFSDLKLWALVGIMGLWSVAICFKFSAFETKNLSYYLFLQYAIFIAYIHIKVFGKDLFPIYEHIMVVFSVISLCLWSIAVVLPPVASIIFHLFPETNKGNNVLFLFQWLDPPKVYEYCQSYSYSLRNAGCSWEPGRFAIMLIPAILFNLSREGVKFRNNKRILILLATLASTMSTTGYSIVMLIYALYWVQEFNTKKALIFLFVALPLSIFIFSLDFMGEKIQDRANFEGLTRERLQDINYNAKKHGDEYIGSLDRFESAYFEWINFQQEPLLGYGRNVDHSWFQQNVSKNYSLTGGLVKILSQYGMFVGTLLYILLFYSSIKISRTCRFQQKSAFAIALLASSISYIIFTIPIFTAFWLYGLFCFEEDEIIADEMEYDELNDNNVFKQE